MRKHTSQSAVLVFAGVLAVALLPSPATAQNALGGGRALDANLNAITGRYNSLRTRFTLNDLNNAIVTGNVPSGIGFRGDVGYDAANAFRGSSSTDGFYRFETDAYFSGMSLVRNQTAQIPRSNFQNNRNTNPLMTPLLRRSSAGTSLGRVSQINRRVNQQAGANSSAASLRIGASGSLGNLRQYNTSLTDLTSSYQPSVGKKRSSLRAGMFDQTSTLRPYRSTVQPSSAINAGRSLPTGVENLSDPLRNPNHVDLSVNRRAGGYSPIDRRSSFDQRESVTSLLRNPSQMSDSSTQTRESDVLNTMAKDFDQKRSGARAATGRPSRTGRPDGKETVAGDAGSEESSSDSSEVYRSRWSSGSQPANIESLYEQYFQQGVDAISDGRYTEAAGRFGVASRLKPDDLASPIGKVNAEIGAGMYLSAALHLQLLFVRSPEAIGFVSYSEILPSRERLDECAVQLSELIEESDWVEGGLILAFVGRCTDQNDLVEMGLEVWGSLVSDEETEDAAMGDSLNESVRGVWLDGP